MTTNPDTLIAAACALKRQLNAQVMGLYDRVMQPLTFDRTVADARAVTQKQYGPAIRAVVVALGTDEIKRRHDEVNQRLHNGWTYCVLHPADKENEQRWLDLLVELEVLTDCLQHQEIVDGTMERIARIEGMVPAMQQGSLV